MSGLYLLYFSKNKPSKSVTAGLSRAGSAQAGSGQFIVLNNSVGPKMLINLYFKYFTIFSNVIEPIEYRRADHIWLLIWTSFASLTRNYLKTCVGRLELCQAHSFNYVAALLLSCVRKVSSSRLNLFVLWHLHQYFHNLYP